MNTSTESMNMVPDEREVHLIFWECLSSAEATLGARSPGWQYKVQLRDTPAYPETVIAGTELVCVWLTKGRSRVGYLYEAGHEAVHCLVSRALRCNISRRGCRCRVQSIARI